MSESLYSPSLKSCIPREKRVLASATASLLGGAAGALEPLGGGAPGGLCGGCCASAAPATVMIARLQNEARRRRVISMGPMGPSHAYGVRKAVFGTSRSGRAAEQRPSLS